MPVMHAAALVLRARSGRNLIVETHGIDSRDAANTATEAVRALQTASAQADPGDIALSVQGLPLTCGCLNVSHGRWSVLYRVVGHMILLLIVPSYANTLSALDFLERAVRVVTLDFRSVETTPEKLWKRYPEIHLSLGILFQTYGGFTARRSLVEANMALESMAPTKKGEGEADKVAAVQEKAAATEKKAAEKKAAADLKAQKKAEKSKKVGNKRIAGTGIAGPQSGVDGQGGGAPADEGRPVPVRRLKKRTIADVASTNLPGVPEAIDTEDPLRNLRALPGFEVGPRTMKGPGYDSQMAALQLQAQKQAGSLGDMLDDMFGGSGEGKKKQDDKKKKDDPFGFVKEELAPLPPPPPPPPPIPPAPLLRLHETWRAKVEGSMVTHVGFSGSVAWATELVDMQPQVPVVGFGLHLPPTHEQQQVLDQMHQQAQARRETLARETQQKGMQEQQAATAALEQQLAQELQQQAPQESTPRQAVKHALQAVWVHPGEVKPGWPPSVSISDAGFTADLANARQLMWPPLLKYTLPAVRAPVPQPLQIAVGGTLESVGEEAMQTGALVGLSLQIAQELSGPMQPAEVEIKLDFAPLFELPLRVSPPGATLDGSKHQLCWKLQSSNEEGSRMIALLAKGPVAFSAAFMVPAGITATQGGLRQVLADVVMHGKKGTTLTGTTLLQHGFYGKADGELTCNWTACASGRPRIPTLKSQR